MKHAVIVGIVLLVLVSGWLLLKPAAQLQHHSTVVKNSTAADFRPETRLSGSAGDGGVPVANRSTHANDVTKSALTVRHRNSVRALHLAKSKNEADTFAELLGNSDYSAAKYEFFSTGFCAKLSELYAQFPDFAAFVDDGAIANTADEKRSFDYLRSRFEQYCDPSVDYSAMASLALRNALSLDTHGSSDAQLIAKVRLLPRNQRAQYVGYLQDIVVNSDAPELVYDAGDLLVGLANWPEGVNFVRGTPLEQQLPQIQAIAMKLVYCNVAGTCNEPDSFDAMQECLENSLCYSGITYWQAVQQTSPPLQFQIAQLLAQHILQSRQGK